jgi:hypothetical protein
MGLRVPQSQIVTSKYTSGKEYIFNSTYREYIGYYYELNGKLFAGKEFSTVASELIKIDSNKVNNLLTHPSTYIYGKISGVKIPQNKITSFPLTTPNANDFPQLLSENPGVNSKVASVVSLDPFSNNLVQFYCSKINSNIIKLIDENIYVKLQNDPLYQTTFIGTYNNKTQTSEVAETQLPGINAFLGL